MAEKMQRPDDYVPLGVRVAFSKTGTKLLEAFGRDGLLVWVLFLAACGRDRPYGELTYTSDEEFWTLLGIAAYPPPFTPAAFLKVTGTMHQTRRTSSGRTQYALATNWNDWNTAFRRQTDREQKRWNRREKQPDTLRRPPDTPPTPPRRPADTEGEAERESSKEGAVVELPPSKGQSEASYADSPLNGSTFRRELELSRLMHVIGDHADDGTLHVIAGYTRHLPAQKLADLSERLERQQPANRAAYAVKALKDELEKKPA